MEKLIHVVPDISYKEAAITYIKEFYEYNSHINGVGGLHRYLDNYESWLEKIEADRHQEPNEERVPAETYFLVRESDNRIVGMINIRLCLNERLQRSGGHIGYSIRPSERQKGYNKINLYLALKRCQELGMEEVVLDCNKNNLGSAKTMQAFGGVLIKEWFDEEDQETEQRYSINVNDAITNYQDMYEPLIGKKEGENECNRSKKLI